VESNCAAGDIAEEVGRWVEFVEREDSRARLWKVGRVAQLPVGRFDKTGRACCKGEIFY